MGIKSRKFSKGIQTKPTTDAATLEGEQRTDSASNEQKIYLDGAERTIVTEDQTQTLSNKTHTDPVLNGDVSGTAIDTDDTLAANSDTKIPSQQAVKTYVDNAVAGKDAADEISYDNTTSGLTATDVQAAVDEVEGRLDTAETDITTAQSTADDHIADTTDAHDASVISYDNAGSTLVSTEVNSAIDALDAKAVNNNAVGTNNATAINNHLTDTVDAHDASAISNVPSGNLAATDVQTALDELQTDIDTRALGSDLSTHIADTSTHGVSGDIVGTSDAQDLSNKTFTDAIILEEQSSTPSNPSSSDKKLYAKNDGKLYTLDSSGNELEVGSGGGASGINYITNPDFETDVSDWTGDTNLSISRDNTSQLRGVGSLYILKGAIDASTQSVTTPFTVDAADLAKKLTISFDYDFDDANYSDGDMQVRIIQDPTGTPSTIRVNGEDIKAGKGTHYAQFQTDATEVDYALELYWADTGTTAVGVYVDNVKVGPTNLAFGFTGHDRIDFTPTGTWGNTTYAGVYWREGQHAIVEYQLTLTGTPSGSLTLDPPSGLTIDTDAFPNFSANSASVMLDGFTLESGVGRYPIQDVLVTNSTTLSPQVFNSSGSIAQTGMSNTAPFTFGSGDTVFFRVEIPIAGWSSNAQMSEDLGGREIIVEGAGNGGTSITANVTDIDFTEVRDTTASWDGSVFTVPESGNYSIAGSVSFTASISGTLELYKNGSLYRSIAHPISTNRKAFNAQEYLEKGDVISIRQDTAGTLDNSFEPTIRHWINIQKLANPQTILETETVAAIYQQSSGQSIPTSSTTTLVFETLVNDTHNAYNTSTGVYTVPVSGFYQINASIVYAQASFSAGTTIGLTFRKNGVSFALITSEINASNTTRPSINNSTLTYLEKGDEVTVLTDQNEGSSRDLFSSLVRNIFSIARIK